MADNRLDRIFKVPESFLKKLPPIQRELFTFLVEKLSKLKRKGDDILPTTENLRVIDAIRDLLHDELLKGDYPKAVKDFAGEFSVQSELTKNYYAAEFGTAFSTGLATSAVNSIKKSVVESLVIDSVRVDFLKPLEETLNIAVQSGSSFTQTVKAIRKFVEGNEGIDGRILQYSKQLAHDSFANADRAYNSAVSDELEIEWFLWAGGEIATSRCFCKERHGKHYHYKEIEAWGRLEDIGDCRTDNGWSGMNRATDEKTIFTYGGGYGCMHTVAGVSIFSVPKEDVVRNIKNGNYEPSKTESEFFGIE